MEDHLRSIHRHIRAPEHRTRTTVVDRRFRLLTPFVSAARLQTDVPEPRITGGVLLSPELQRALKRHTQWFGSYKASGELKKIQVWLVVNVGQIEFLTPGSSYKVKRVRRNPRVICYVGSEDGPTIPGTAQIIADRGEVARVYRAYWKVHPLPMAILIGLRVWIEMLLNKRVVVRVQPDEPNPLAGLTDPAI